jgi:hypothetical protein
MALRACAVSFVDVRGVRHSVEVEAESLYEAAVLATCRFRGDPWIHQVGPGTVLDIEVREPSTRHSISLQQVERWLGGATTNPNEAMKKARLKTMLVQS